VTSGLAGVVLLVEQWFSNTILCAAFSNHSVTEPELKPLEKSAPEAEPELCHFYNGSAALPPTIIIRSPASNDHNPQPCLQRS